MLAFINIDGAGALLMKLSGVMTQKRFLGDDLRIKRHFTRHPAFHDLIIKVVKHDQRPRISRLLLSYNFHFRTNFCPNDAPQVLQSFQMGF